MAKNFFPPLIIFFILYTLFWFKFFHNSNSSRSSPVVNDAQKNLSGSFKTLGSLTFSAPTPGVEPGSYKIDLLPRKQAFNLSCEFAAATAIIYHYTNDLLMDFKNQKEAEKTLISKIGVSKNPNLGIRMGENALESLEILYQNLNFIFGGSDYYGVHAPPFIDLFKSYGLKAEPLNKNGDIVNDIKKSVFKGHLVMAWLNVGRGNKIDLALSYGNVPVVKGEHVVVINGYNENGFFVMDSGIGKERFVNFNELLDAAKLFAFPYLEVYPSNSYFSFNLSVPIDKTTGFNRNLIKIKIKNASRVVGVADEMRNTLKEFGYKVTSIESLNCIDCFDIKISLKKELKDYVNIFKKDLELAFYKIDSIYLDLPEDDLIDIVITIGQ